MSIQTRTRTSLEFAESGASLDGSGYPRGLCGDELFLPARILAVADIVEAVTVMRPYREPIPVDDVLAELDRNAGTKLDAACMCALRESVVSSR